MIDSLTTVIECPNCEMALYIEIISINLVGKVAKTLLTSSTISLICQNPFLFLLACNGTVDPSSTVRAYNFFDRNLIIEPHVPRRTGSRSILKAKMTLAIDVNSRLGTDIGSASVGGAISTEHRLSSREGVGACLLRLTDNSRVDCWRRSRSRCWSRCRSRRRGLSSSWSRCWCRLGNRDVQWYPWHLSLDSANEGKASKNFEANHVVRVCGNLNIGSARSRAK